MALEIITQHVQGQQVNEHSYEDISGTYDALNNTTGYGSPNDERSDRANYLLISKNDKNGTRTYITIANTTPLSTMIWAFTSTADGWHQGTILSVNKWANGAHVVDDVVFYTTTGLFYNCIEAHSNIAPDSGSGSQYWEEVTDFTEIQQGHTNLEVYDYDFNIESRRAVDIADELSEALDENFRCQLQPDEAVDLLNMIAMLEGANSEMLQGNPEQTEEIMLSIEECVNE